MSHTQNIFNFQEHEVGEIPKGYIFDGLICPVEVYVQLKSQTFLLIARPGQKIDLSEYKSYSRKDFRLFVKAQDKFLFNGLIDATLQSLMNRPDAPLSFQSRLVNSVLEETLRAFETAKFLDISRVQTTGRFVMTLYGKSKALKGLIESLDEIPGSQSKNALAAAVLSLMIAEEAKMLNSLSEEKIVMGALLHDIGLKHIPREILSKPRSEWSLQELSVYQTHPRLGAEIVRHLPDVPMDVILVVAQHHENSKGTGYPEGLRDVKISPLAKVVGLANQVAELLFDEDQNRLSIEEAAQYIEEVLGQPFNKGLWVSFKNIVNREYLAQKAYSLKKPS